MVPDTIVVVLNMNSRGRAKPDRVHWRQCRQVQDVSDLKLLPLAAQNNNHKVTVTRCCKLVTLTIAALDLVSVKALQPLMTYLLDALSCCRLVNAPKLFRTVLKLARTWGRHVRVEHYIMTIYETP